MAALGIEHAEYDDRVYRASIAALILALSPARRLQSGVPGLCRPRGRTRSPSRSCGVSGGRSGHCAAIQAARGAVGTSWGAGHVGVGPNGPRPGGQPVGGQPTKPVGRRHVGPPEMARCLPAARGVLGIHGNGLTGRHQTQDAIRRAASVLGGGAYELRAASWGLRIVSDTRHVRARTSRTLRFWDLSCRVTPRESSQAVASPGVGAAPTLTIRLRMPPPASAS